MLSFWVRSSCLQIKELFLITEKAGQGRARRRKERCVSVNPSRVIMDTCFSKKEKKEELKKNSIDTVLGVLHITLYSCSKAEYGEAML